MSGTSAATTSELRKLAHVLGVDVGRLSSLSGVPAADLRTLRGQISDALFEADRPRFAKVAALSKAIPVPIAAKVTEHAFPPLLAARTAELVDPHKASELVARLSDTYLADVSAAMDPARAPAVVASIPAERIARVGAELARRGEWIVIAGFIDHVSGPALAATVATFTGEQLLRVGFVLDDKTRLDDVAGLVSDEQLDAMCTAALECDLWPELDDLVANLSVPRIARISTRYAAAHPSLHAAAAQAAANGTFSAESLGLLAGSG
ncbi:MAG TPA: hypothetical protein VGN35_08530 [Jatrophihabitantaceae bacterium]|jgi:hypothetical protein|nr:hypothetical protein [Jatrophihabitantaceae bacterium]